MLIGLLVFQTALASFEVEQLSEPAVSSECLQINTQDVEPVDPPLDGEGLCLQCCDCHCCGFASPVTQLQLPFTYGAVDFRSFIYFSVAVVYPSAVYRPPITRA